MKVELVQQRKKKRRVQVSTSANDKHEERMQKVGRKEKKLGKEE